MNPQQAIERLAAGALAGEENEARRLIDEAAGRLLLRALRRPKVRWAGRGSNAADAGLDCLGHVWIKRKQYEGHSVGEFYSWFDQVCERRAIDLWRSRQRKREKPFGLMFNVEQGAMSSQGHNFGTIAPETRAALYACLGELRSQSLDLYNVVASIVYARMEIRRVKTMLNLPRATVYARWDRARRAMAECLSERGVTVSL